MNPILSQPRDYTFNHFVDNSYTNLLYSSFKNKHYITHSLDLYGLIKYTEVFNYLCLR